MSFKDVSFRTGNSGLRPGFFIAFRHDLLFWLYDSIKQEVTLLANEKQEQEGLHAQDVEQAHKT